MDHLHDLLRGGNGRRNSVSHIVTFFKYAAPTVGETAGVLYMVIPVT
jgi:hypothetical protein